MTIYTSKKTGATYTNLTALGNGKFQLTSTEDPTDTFTVAESTLKRWYKKSVTVDFTTAEEKPVEVTKKVTTKKTVKTSKKATKHHAKTYEEQTWGLGHTRISSGTFCSTLNLSSISYDKTAHIVTLFDGANPVARRRGWENEITGSVWFRFHNYEYELIDVAYAG